MLATAGETIAREELKQRRRAAAGLRRARRAMDAEAALPEAEGGYTTGRKRTGLRLTFHAGLPESTWGRVAAGAVFAGVAAVLFAGAVSAERLALRDQRFVIPGASAIAVEGLHHLARNEVLQQMNAAPHGATGQNIFAVSLAEQRARLEAMPWVEHAAVMRLLPDRLRASVTERTPVAFARAGARIGLVDANGVLLDMRGPAEGAAAYSFPVVTGIVAADPLSVRASRMKLFAEFVGALDSGGEHLSAKLSEVDLSNPEDVKAVIPESGTDVLVHFGSEAYLERFRQFERLLPEWRTQYPKLAGVDMRYERQVVLEMQPGAGIAAASEAPQGGEAAGTPAHAPGKGKAAVPGVHKPVSAAKAHAAAVRPVKPWQHPRTVAR